MKPTEVNRFKKFYQRHLRLLKLQGKSQKTIDAYSRGMIGDGYWYIDKGQDINIPIPVP